MLVRQYLEPFDVVLVLVEDLLFVGVFQPRPVRCGGRVLYPVIVLIEDADVEARAGPLRFGKAERATGGVAGHLHRGHRVGEAGRWIEANVRAVDERRVEVDQLLCVDV